MVVLFPVQRIDVVADVLPHISPERVRFLRDSAKQNMNIGRTWLFGTPRKYASSSTVPSLEFWVRFWVWILSKIREFSMGLYETLNDSIYTFSRATGWKFCAHSCNCCVRCMIWFWGSKTPMCKWWYHTASALYLAGPERVRAAALMQLSPANGWRAGGSRQLVSSKTQKMADARNSAEKKRQETRQPCWFLLELPPFSFTVAKESTKLKNKEVKTDCHSNLCHCSGRSDLLFVLYLLVPVTDCSCGR